MKIQIMGFFVFGALSASIAYGLGHFDLGLLVFGITALISAKWYRHSKCHVEAEETNLDESEAEKEILDQDSLKPTEKIRRIENGRIASEPSRKNECTVLQRSKPCRVLESDFRKLFMVISDEVLEQRESKTPAFHILAIDSETKQVISKIISYEEINGLTPLTVGRHDQSDIPLTYDEGTSLRHVLILLGQDREKQAVIRALDLRTDTKMIDSVHDVHSSIATNGPLAMRIGRTILFVFPHDFKTKGSTELTYENIEWPSKEKWVPEKSPESYLSERSKHLVEPTIVSMVDLDLYTDFSESANKIGQIGISYNEYSEGLDVSLVDLRRGVLFGRYERCDLNGSNCFLPSIVSRVHALFIEVDDVLYVFDTGSTNGLTFDGKKIISMPLRHNQLVEFKIQNTSIAWQPVNNSSHNLQ